ncbi:MAG TPA: EAL domain-containing protein [Rhodanobacteraceae bacterium]|nr:EAL domain-containing protein [Rhodanobacteraceae bacterium]
MKHRDSDQVIVRSFEFSPNPDLIFDLTAAGNPVVCVNAALEKLLGIDRQHLLGHLCAEVLGPEQGVEAIDLNAAGSHVVHYRLGSRTPFWCRLEVSPLADGDGHPTHSICTLHDISEHVGLRHNRDFQMRHDVLTGLVRMPVFEERLTVELVRAVNACARVIVCHVDIDRLGAINRAYDFTVGDQVLGAVARRLHTIVSDPALACRITSNKFLVAFDGADAGDDQLEVGMRLATVLAPPIEVGALSVRVTASIGVSCFPDTGSDVRELQQQAAAAAHQARRGGGDDVQVFVPAERAALHTRLRLGEHLHGAVERGEFVLHYQPIIGIAKREVLGMEALVRWQSPELGLVTPDAFISLAEDLGMIADIGRWVLHQACAQARRWLDQGVGDFTMSVNVSGLQLRNRQLLEDVSMALNAARLPAACLDLELTETAIMPNLEQASALMAELGQMGVKLSLDDFGVGQSSLGYLQRLPVNRLKIDRSFVAGVPDDMNAVRICRAVIGLAHEFGFVVVAEGVEHAVQLAFLEHNSCEYAQGHYFSAAVPAEQMLEVLRKQVLRPRVASAATSAEAGVVLLVDDEQNVLRALARVLRRDGYRILTATSFGAAFEILGNNDVQLVMSDHRMPDGKGTEFLGRVKALHPHTVRMILSGYADVGAVTEAINGGAVHRFLTKPWDDDKLRAIVRDAMRFAHDGGSVPG